MFVMKLNPYPCKLLVVLILLHIPFLASCSGGGIRKVDLPQNMAVFKDSVKKMMFALPAGWEAAPVDPAIEKATSFIRSMDSLIGFRKGERGTLAVWCDSYNPNRIREIHMLDVLRDYAPMFQPAHVRSQIESPGSGFISTPILQAYKASHVSKGQKKNFQIITVTKGTPTTMLYGCEYMLFGRSSSDEFSEEILNDITAISATLTHPEK
jgi:hypothetical protein